METDKVTRIRTVMLDLIDCRRQLIAGTLTLDQAKDLKQRITAKIDWGNRSAYISLLFSPLSNRIDIRDGIQRREIKGYLVFTFRCCAK